MAFDIVVPSEGDAATITSTHLLAMDDNELLQAKYPDHEARVFLREEVMSDTLGHIADGKRRRILVAKDPETGKIASFIKWRVGCEDDGQVGGEQQEEKPPASFRKHYADVYASITTGARNQLMGDKPFYHVTFLCTDPEWGGRGAATALLRRVMDQAAAEKMRVVLESTKPAVSFYKKLNFDSFTTLDMSLPPPSSSQQPDRYGEQVMVWPAGDYQ